MRQTSLRELTTLGIKNAENLAIPSVRNDVSFQNFFLYFCIIKWNYTWHIGTEPEKNVEGGGNKKTIITLLLY